MPTISTPFLSFTDTVADPAIKYIVVKADPTGDAGYDRGLIAGVPVGVNVRTSLPDGPPTGWWHSGTVDGLSVEIVEGW